MFLRETFFLARAYPSVRPSVFRRWVFFLFVTELVTKMIVTDDYYTDGLVPSVIISPTEFIPVIDRISPSVKLFNGVVISVILPSHRDHFLISKYIYIFFSSFVLFTDLLQFYGNVIDF
jgi:hypothetical protein